MSGRSYNSIVRGAGRARHRLCSLNFFPVGRQGFFRDLDSLCYMSVDGMLDCVRPPRENYCTACFTGKYAIPVKDTVSKNSLEV